MMEKSKNQIGFYGGTFDPIHFGHLNLAIEMLEIHGLKEIWFCPAWINPHRQNENPVSIDHRIKMIELAISDVPQFHLCTFEAHKKSPSYTVETIQSIIQEEQEKPNPAHFSLILGEDAARTFFQWKDPEKIVDMVPLLVGCRNTVNSCRSGDIASYSGSKKIIDAIKKGMTPTRFLQISSTGIRERISKNLYCKYLTPSKVMDYIYDNHLYCLA